MVLNGIDISSWQGAIDLAAVPADFVIVKATESTNYINPYCDSRYQLAKKAGKLLGLYHYAKNGDPIAEADFFYNNIKGYVGEAILFLDYEEGLSTNSPAWCRQFLDRLQERTGIKGLLYTYQSMLNSQNWQTVKDGDYGLWYASYGANAVTSGYRQPAAPTVRYWGSPAIYQYSSETTLSGYSGRLDANVFYGTKTDWQAYAGQISRNEPAEKEAENQESQGIAEGSRQMKPFIYRKGNAHYFFDGTKIRVIANEVQEFVIRAVYDQQHHTSLGDVKNWEGNEATWQAFEQLYRYDEAADIKQLQAYDPYCVLKEVAGLQAVKVLAVDLEDMAVANINI